jgi:hypothetical protein
MILCFSDLFISFQIFSDLFRTSSPQATKSMKIMKLRLEGGCKNLSGRVVPPVELR